MRVYLPATSALLRTWDETGIAQAVGGIGYGVTPALREAYREGDVEELEWVAQVAAGMAALRMISADPAALPVRFVLAADVADDALRTPPGLEQPAQLLLDEPVPRAAWASVLADDPASGADQRVVAAAAEAWRRTGGLADESLTDLLDDAEAVELGWFGVQEVPALLATATKLSGRREG